MGLFDDIVPPDMASGGGYTLSRITARLSPDQVRGSLFETGAARPPQDEGVELPQRPGDAPQSPADASDENGNFPAQALDDVTLAQRHGYLGASHSGKN